MPHRSTFIISILQLAITISLTAAQESVENNTAEHEGLFMVTRDRVYKIDLETAEKTEITSGFRGATAIDYDFEKKIIVLSDVTLKCLYKVDIETGNKTVLASGRIMVPDGLAVDWIHENVYWTDTGTDTISVVSLDGNWRKKIFETDLNEPRAIVLDPIEGWMFWSDWGHAKIERAGMDGSRRSNIVSNIGWPNGLALDFASKKLYWIDAKIENICSSDYDGSNKNVILGSSSTVNHPFALDQFENWLYWDDWRTGNVYRAQKLTGEHAKIIASGFTSPMGLRFLHSSRQPKGRNQCAEFGKCSHLCLPAPTETEDSKGFVCDCPNGMVLADNQEFCTGTPDNNCEYDPAFICASGRCIKASWVCDGEDDCNDNSDEQSCTTTTTTTTMRTVTECPYDPFFKCQNGRCVRATWVCDGDDDCRDGSDENKCEKSSTTTTHTPEQSTTASLSTATGIHCPYAPAFFCANGRACIKRGWICDGDNDCSDGSDEKDCSECPLELPLPCGNGRCIRRNWLCDGDNDCGNDEHNCTVETTEMVTVRFETESDYETTTDEIISYRTTISYRTFTPETDPPPESSTESKSDTRLLSTPSLSVVRRTEEETGGAGKIGGAIFGIVVVLAAMSVVGFYIYKQHLRRHALIHLDNPVYEKHVQDPSNMDSTKDNVILPI